jgi:type I restriction enzyme S subunit
VGLKAPPYDPNMKHADIFKKYLFNNHTVQYYFSKSAKGTTRKILGLNYFYNLRVPIPPLKEQIKIANYLDEKTQKIDNITQTISKKIELLKEFRKTLINDVVTGRVKV